MQDYDIIVVGAGLVGSAFAGMAARNLPYRIAVVERAIPQAVLEPSQQSRPISLSHGSVQILKTLDWWSALQEFATPIKRVEVSQQDRLGVVNFQAEDWQVPALGQVVPYDFLHQTVYQAMAEHPQVSFYVSEQIESLQKEGSRHVLTLQAGGEAQKLSAKLLIIADGVQSECREKLNIPAATQGESSVAIVGELHLLQPHKHQAYQRFCKQGVLATLPLADLKKQRFVVSVSERQAADMSRWSPRRWLSFWRRQMRGRLLVESVTVGKQFPLRSVMAKEVVQPGVVLLGNAAHTLYPLAAQGFNLALRDVAALSELLVEERCLSPQSLASFETLSSYAAWRGDDAKRLSAFTQGMSQGFSCGGWLLSHLRGLAMMGLDAVPGGKRALGQWLMGLGGRVPKLVRGVALTEEGEWV